MSVSVDKSIRFDPAPTNGPSPNTRVHPAVTLFLSFLVPFTQTAMNQGGDCLPFILQHQKLSRRRRLVFFSLLDDGLLRTSRPKEIPSFFFSFFLFFVRVYVSIK